MQELREMGNGLDQQDLAGQLNSLNCLLNMKGKH